MKTAICKLVSASPYSQSKHHMTEKLDKENNEDFEKRTWKEKCNVTDDGFIFIPPMSFSKCIQHAAKHLSIAIPGEGKAKYTKHFESGILVTEGLKLPIRKEDVKGEWLFVPSDGVRGGGKRVSKCFPLITEWKGTVKFIILDNKITQEVFTRVIKEAGILIGIGRFRPCNTGYYGRFNVEEIKWEEQ
jgi:hypothetical protein